MRKWLLGLAAAFCIVLCLTENVSAAEIVDSGYCGGEGDGTNLTWVLDSNGTLTISGTGAMKDFGYFDYPWGNHIRDAKSIIIQDGVTSIGARAFFQSVDIDNSYHFNRYGYFASSIQIPESVTSIGSEAFWGCHNLKELAIPNSVVSIGEAAFGYCDNLTTVYLSKNVLEINGNVFYACRNLKDILVSNKNAAYTSIDGILYNKELTELISCPCAKSGEVTIPETVVKIDAGAFGACERLSAIEFLGRISELGAGAFTGCIKLERITIPSGVEIIDVYTFSDCINLTSISIPSSITIIGGYAFWGCNSLKDVYYGGTENQWRSVYISSNNVPLTNATLHYREYISPLARTTFSTTLSGTKVRTAKTGTKTVKFNAGLYATENNLTEMDIAWNLDWFHNVSSEYNNDLAIAGLVLSANAEDTGAELVTDTLKKLGFTNIVSGNYDGYHGNNDKVGYTIARTSGGSDQFRRTNYIIVVCRGSVGGFDDEDWRSNLNSREDGFERAADNVLNGDAYSIGLNAYISQYVNTAYPTKIFITGHSRGGAVANDLAIKVENEDYISTPSNVFVYTYACPNTTPRGQATNYDNIFNVINIGDQVPNVPWFVNKRGVRVEFDKERIVGKLDSEFLALTGKHSSVIDFPGIVYVEPCYGGYAMNDYPVIASAVRNHSPAIYMAYLISEESKTVTRDFRIKRVSVKCPVDVYVYDNADNLLGSVINNVAGDELLSKGFYVEIEGDEKYIYMPSDFDVQIELSGTGLGTMTYSVEEIDGGTGIVDDERTFTDVAISDGKTMTSTVTGDIAAADTQLFVETGGAVTAEVDVNGNETDVVMLSFDTGFGEPLRDMAVPRGGKATTLPTAKMDGYTFAGWYRDAALIYEFDVNSTLNSATTLYAKFEPIYDAYGYFTNIAYDGSALTARLEYEYNTTGAHLVVALYQGGQMIGVQSRSVASGASVSSVSMPISGLYGSYQLKGFLLDPLGNCTPVSASAEVSFYAN